MSGGSFDYKQWEIRRIWEELESKLETQGKEKSKEELWMQKEYYEQYPEEKYYPKYPEKVNEIMREGIKYLKLAEIYTQRIDWYLSGDDGEQSLYNRLKEDLEKLNQ